MVTIVGVLALAAVGASRASQPPLFGPGQFTVWGEGHSTCETWLAGRNKSVGTPEHSRTAQMRHWMLGFVSASAWAFARGPGAQKFKLKDSDAGALDARMDEVCTAFGPRVQFSVACVRLVNTLTVSLK
jgi:hypothetical protein